ncbi:FAD-dependent oxidoreductase [Bacillus sp. FJAT-42376]|uniref:dihydrolipoyl dehydrogenase family protein n=1 Tax=Bacillus sp. FJAT-42376 TaxID=2014076 RepID=UPI000F5171CB|nr:FAD-dependent oxidoreductase [Bacillus sp. FJAT-42376]AZB44059.1 FAD-dependent oxidoreductase [Bacillus sp. FJAT-42376]
MKYDLIVIGGGSGGLTAASGAASFGAKVALIEKRSTLGGDCLHVGCVPSKALIHQANEFFTGKKVAAEQGFKLTADFEKVKASIQTSIQTIQDHDSDERFEQMGVDVFHGTAEFTGTHEVRVNGETITGKRFVIAVGSSPLIPDIEGLKEAGFQTNETIFSMESFPEKLAIIGGGPIGVEMGQAFARMGSKVTVIDRSSKILSKEDEEIRDFMTGQLSKELTIYSNTEVEKISVSETGKVVHVKTGEKKEAIEADEILLAMGRVPNTKGLNCETAGINLNDHGHVIVNEYLQSSQKHIFAAGDVTGQYIFTHAAGQEGKTIVQNAVFGVKSKISYENMPWNVYTRPEVFHLGLTEKEAEEKHGKITVYKKRLNEVDRFVTEQESGFIKLIMDQKGKIIGAHAAGEGAGDWMQSVVMAKTNGDKLRSLSGMVYPYPNRAAAIQTAADLYWREKLFDGGLKKWAARYIKWFR